MSHQPIRASADLSRLANEGFDLAIETGHLVVRGVPFVDSDGVIRHGTVLTVLSLAGDRTIRPQSHVAYFGGGTPHDNRGQPLRMLHTRQARHFGDDMTIDHMMSSQPVTGNYPDYHALITTYIAEIEGHARAIDPTVGARRAVRTVSPAARSVFRYQDTASSRAQIGAFTDKLRNHSIAIVGLGGGGSYILDLVAKTPVSRIHLWDPDVFEQHTAFRAPGAPTLEELGRRPAKVDYLASIYGRMHAGIVPHRSRLGPSNLQGLRNVDFVFIAVDSAASRRPIVEFLEMVGKPFIDIGMGLHVSDAGIVGTVRVTTSTDEMRGHVRERGRIPMTGDDDADDPYSSNVQVADLNCLNAALAVVRWKRHLGFYADFEREHWSAYVVDGNTLMNDERPVDTTT
ncbi:ThiF family adenylyltransferase [Sphingomonas sp. PP-CE-1G-424]|uniref:ThiF family adenylyltransferase n=1 Tax=Sphingomonas sp. PP-CE-1G-424 TaxID=2135658 RepID=UPI001055AF6A|nr:ThiF family adenylyltransferase [Sphingomonas sp. PP-CE-1G-424]TCP65353.1 ThiF family protein [Sphingomonas sp. PP-CE-1G-424]